MNKVKRFAPLLLVVLLAAPCLGQRIIPNPGDANRSRIDVESYLIEARIDPESRQLSGTVEIRFTQLDRQRSVLFDLDRRLRVDRVYLGDENPLPTQFRQYDDSTLMVDLSDLEDFEEPVLRVEYRGQVVLDPEDPEPEYLGIEPDGVFLLEEGKWYPMNGVRQDAAEMQIDLHVPPGWEVVTTLPERRTEESAAPVPDPEAGAAAVAAAFGGVGPAGEEVPPPVPEPPEDSPNPPQLIDTDNPVAELFGTEESRGAGTEFSFASDVPGFWGTVIAGDFNRVAPPFADGVVEALVSDDVSAGASELGAMASDLIAFYSDVFGPPPVPTLRLIEVKAPEWKGQSAPGMLLLPSSAFSADYDPWELAQEVARQWFPNKFAVADPVADVWISEGMAVFASLYYFGETLPPDETQEYVRRTLVRALSYEGDAALLQAGSLPAGSAQFRAVAGYRAAFVFRMLREVMGTGLFRSFLTEFSTMFANRPVTTSALEDLASDVAGQDLGYFFGQWLNEAHVPVFERVYRIFRLPVQGGYKVEGQITQDLDLFSMPVEIEVLTDGEPEYQTVFLSGPSSDIDIYTERKPRGIVIDPMMKVLRMSEDIRVAVHINRGEDLVAADDPNRAIQEYQAAIDIDRLSSLAFFRMGEALFDLNALPSAADMFREALNGDLEPTWIEVWSYINLGKIYDLRIQRDRALIEYEKAVNTGDDAYGAQAEVQRYIERPFRVR